MTARRLRALLICYYFPPVGGAGINRPLGMVRHLPENGVDCDVLTVKPIAYCVMEPELLDGLDESRIHRAGSTDPLRLLYLAGVHRLGRGSARRARPASRRLFPDSKIGWVRPAIRLGADLLKSAKYDIIMSTSPPISCHLVARELASRTGLPWLADFRDPWTSHTIEDWYRRPQMVNRARQLLESIRSRAAAVTTANDAIAEYLGGGVPIPTGFDPELAQRWRPPSDPSRFIIGVLGTIDSLTPLAPLIQLLVQVHELSPRLFERIAIRHVGQLDDPKAAALLAAHGLADRFESHGIKDRVSTVNLLSDCSLMYLGMACGRAEMLTPGRIFDLIASGRPILAHAGDQAEVAQIVRNVGNGCCFQTTDRDSVQAAAVHIVGQAETTATATISPLPAYAEPWSMSSTMARLADLIKSLTD